MKITLRDGNLTADITRRGGVVAGAWFHGDAFLAAPGSDIACFPLVPFGNRVAGNGFSFREKTYSFRPNTPDDPLYLHGDGWLGDWEVAESGSDHVTLRFERAADAASPYSYRAVQEFRLGNECMTLALAVTNTGPEPLPFGIGLHPFFPKTPATRLNAAASRMWSEVEGYLPGAPGPLPEDLDFGSGRALPSYRINNAFEHWDGRASIVWPDRGLSLSIAASSAFRNYMLYQPDTSAFFCFEPMSHLPNGHNLPALGGLDSLAPGDTLSGTMRLSPTRKDTL